MINLFTLFEKQLNKHLGFFSPAFASSPHSCLAPGFMHQSGLGWHDSTAIFVL
ncbi:hypothetical protein ACQKLG_02735 [Pedobacter suwonensis]|uniref:hypothetical protein n=1 Tax=Pedobacter suwonensis TaxID=332999 RepID=UPI00381D094D